MTDSQATAEQLVTARRAARGLAEFPGPVPATVADAYAIQLAALDLWPEPIFGWKAGRITGDRAVQFGADRFIGPVLAVTLADGGETDVPFAMIEGGLGACEQEFVVRIAHDTPADKTDWTVEEARAITASFHIGMEVAGSPVFDLLRFGPLASIADLGTNVGLIVGPAVEGWQSYADADLSCTTLIDGEVVMSRTADFLPGGPFAALAFALGQAARMGHPMQKGHYVSTGAITGIHKVSAGQRCVTDFGDLGRIQALVVNA